MKEYTAQEMREVADSLGKTKSLVCKADFWGVDENGEREIKYVPDYKSTDGISLMLRQAADMRDRCENVLRANAKDLKYRHKDADAALAYANYILRGDAGKEATNV